MIKKCEICGVSFNVPQCVIAKNKGKFCSNKCYGEYRKTFKGTKGGNWKGGPIEVPCKGCGKIFRIPLWEKTKGRAFCKPGCATKGNRNPRWNNGVTTEYVYIRSHKKYSEWRESVFKRDGYRCLACGDSKGHNLNAHHLKSFKKILQDIRDKYPLLSIKDVGENHDELWDVNNGITLCRKCHIKEHSK